MGPGPFVAALEYAAGRTATVCGKPNGNIFLQALGDYQPSEAIMFGDDVTDDIQVRHPRSTLATEVAGSNLRREMFFVKNKTLMIEKKSRRKIPSIFSHFVFIDI